MLSRSPFRYSLSLRNPKEMMAEQGVAVDHATNHRLTAHGAPLLLGHGNRRKRQVTRKWQVAETMFVRIRG